MAQGSDSWGGAGMEQDGTGMEQGGEACSTLPGDPGFGGLVRVGVFASLGDFLRSTGHLFHRTGFPRCAGAGPAQRRPRELRVTLRWVWTRRCAAAAAAGGLVVFTVPPPGWCCRAFLDFYFLADGLNFPPCSRFRDERTAVGPALRICKATG